VILLRLVLRRVHWSQDYHSRLATRTTKHAILPYELPSKPFCRCSRSAKSEADRVKCSVARTFCRDISRSYRVVYRERKREGRPRLCNQPLPPPRPTLQSASSSSPETHRSPKSHQKGQCMHAPLDHGLQRDGDCATTHLLPASSAIFARSWAVWSRVR